MRREIKAKPAIQLQRRLAIRLGREYARPPAAELLAQLDVIVNLAIGDQRSTARLIERLVAGREVDDGEPGLHHPDIAGAISAIAIRAAVAQRPAHRPQRRRGWCGAIMGHQPGDAAHQGATRSKKLR
jgi:hypothetical protein